MVLGLFGKGTEIGIEVEGEGPFVPGDTVKAVIVLGGDKPPKAREVRAGLVLWQRVQELDTDRDADGSSSTSRQWRTDETWVTREVLDDARAEATDEGRRYHFEWTIPPDAPPTYDGKITKNRWLAKVTVDRRLARDTNEEVEIEVLAPARERPAESVFGVRDRGTDMSAIRFDLPRTHYSEGETVAGRVIIEPRQDFEARAIRLELARVETVTSGDRRHVERVVVQQQELAGKTTLQRDTPLEYSFEFSIPAQDLPTHRTSRSYVEWLLSATLDRQMRSDVEGVQELLVYNAPVKE